MRVTRERGRREKRVRSRKEERERGREREREKSQRGKTAETLALFYLLPRLHCRDELIHWNVELSQFEICAASDTTQLNGQIAKETRGPVAPERDRRESE